MKPGYVSASALFLSLTVVACADDEEPSLTKCGVTAGGAIQKFRDASYLQGDLSDNQDFVIQHTPGTFDSFRVYRLCDPVRVNPGLPTRIAAMRLCDKRLCIEFRTQNV